MIRLSATLPSAAAIGGEGESVPFNISDTFDGTAGYFFDANDLSTLKEDTAGTTAASVLGPVGKMLDKSGNGNHLVARTDAQRPILCRRPKSTEQRNFIANSEDWSTYLKSGATYSKSTSGTSPLNGQSATVHTVTNTANTAYIVPQNMTKSMTNVTYSFYLKVNASGANPIKGVYLFFPGQPAIIFNAVDETTTEVNTVISSSITAVAGYSGWYKCTATFASLGYGYYILLSDGTTDFQATITSGQSVEIQGFQRESGTSATNFQQTRNNNGDDYTEDGIDSVHYLKIASDAMICQNVPHESNETDSTIVTRVALEEGTVLSKGVNSTSTSYRLRRNVSSGSSLFYKIGPLGLNSGPAVSFNDDTIVTIRCTLGEDGVANRAKIYIDGTHRVTGSINNLTTNFGNTDAIGLFGMITNTGSTPTVGELMEGEFHSAYYINRLLTASEAANVGTKLEQSSGAL